MQVNISLSNGNGNNKLAKSANFVKVFPEVTKSPKALLFGGNRKDNLKSFEKSSLQPSKTVMTDTRNQNKLPIGPISKLSICHLMTRL